MTAPDRHPAGAADQPAWVLELVGERLHLIADPTRMRIMRHLESSGAASVQQICDGLSASRKTVSRHLQMMLRAGLVIRERDATWMRYELADFTALLIIEKMTASVHAQLEERYERFGEDT